MRYISRKGWRKKKNDITDIYITAILFQLLETYILNTNPVLTRAF